MHLSPTSKLGYLSFNAMKEYAKYNLNKRSATIFIIFKIRILVLYTDIQPFLCSKTSCIEVEVYSVSVILPNLYEI